MTATTPPPCWPGPGTQAGRGRRRPRGPQDRRGLGGDALGASLVGPGDARHESSCRWVGRAAPRSLSSRSSSSPPRWAAPPSPGAATSPTRSRATTGSRTAGPASRPATCRPGGSRTSPTAPSPCPRRPRRSSTGTSRRWPTRSAPPSWPGSSTKPTPGSTPTNRGRTPSGRRAGHFDIALAESASTGTVHIDGDLDLADALDLDAAIAADAHEQLLLGSTESLDVRRSIAAGNLARNQHTLDLANDRPRAAPASARWCCTSTSNTPPSSGRRPRPAPGDPGSVTAEQVRLWCATPDTQVTVQPVLDLADHIHVNAYEASARLKLQTQLRDLVCAFPHCFRPAEECDCEHRVPHDRDDGGGRPAPATKPPLQAPPPRQDHRRLDLPDRRTRRLPLAQPPGLPVPPRPHRHPRHHPRRRPRSPAPSPGTSTPDHPAPHPARHHTSGELGAPKLVTATRAWLRVPTSCEQPTRTASPSRRSCPARCPRRRPCPAQQRRRPAGPGRPGIRTSNVVRRPVEACACLLRCPRES